MPGFQQDFSRSCRRRGAFCWRPRPRRPQSFPSKPVHILVPYAAGGAVDVLARTLGQSLSKTWGQQPVIENRPGAGGIIASQALTQSAPDGYTLILVASGHPLNQFFYPKLPYDTFKDFTAISEVAYSPLAIVVSKDSPMKNLGDLLATAREKPEVSILRHVRQRHLGASGRRAAQLHGQGQDPVAIPYKGGAPALTAVIAGEIPISVNPLPEVVGQLEGNAVRALAVTTAQRSKALPDVPTVAEAGIAGYDASVWWGVLGPAGMAPDVVAKIHADLAAALKDPVVLTALEKMGATPVGSSPTDFDAFMRAEADEVGAGAEGSRLSRCSEAAGAYHRAFAGACTCQRSARQCSTTASIKARPAAA